MNILHIFRVIILLGMLSAISVFAGEPPKPGPIRHTSAEIPIDATVATVTTKSAGGATLAQSTGSLLNVTAGLVLVLGLIAAAAWLVRRFGQFQVSASGHLKILGGLHLSAREKLVLVQVGEQQLLIGVSPGSVRTLHVLQSPLSVVSTDTQGKSAFAEKLYSALAGVKR